MKHPKTLIVLDLETTGIWIEKDKIIEIAMIKCHPGGGQETYLKKVNPGMPIPPRITEITGIRDEDVKGAPNFKDIAGEVSAFLADSDLAGYNVERMDLPLLERELQEAGYKFDWKNRPIYDAQTVYHLNERRDLTTAYKFYCSKELTNAHSALADAQATYEILRAQIARYGNGSEALEALDCFKYAASPDFYGRERRFRWWGGQLYPLFGRYAKKSSLQEIARKDPDYLRWVLASDFSDEIKELVEDALRGKFPEYPSAKASRA